MATSGPERAALVTGAARRVGRAIALELAAAGCHLAVHYHRSEAEAAALAGEIRAAGRRAVSLPADLSDSLQIDLLVQEAARQLGGLDVLVNNAAVFDRVPLDRADADAWQRTLAVNLIAPALLTRAAAPYLRAGGRGRVVNLIDVLADRPVAAYGPYCASKAALACLTRTLALELAPEVSVNGVAPGIAVFPENYDAALRRHLTDRVPLKREGSPAEVARLVRFLVEQEGYITGQIIAIDGGVSLV